MQRTLTVLIVIVMIGSPVFGASDYQPGYSSSHALVVGINKYQQWPHLEYAVKDATEVAAVLNAMGFHIHRLTDEQATRKNILRKLDIISKAVDVN